jgi:hypothetical protein
MRSTLSTRDWFVLAFFCLVAPFVHFYVQLYWSMLAIRAVPVTRSQVFTAISLYAGDLMGAVLAALVLALPLAWLIRRRPFFLAALLASTTTVVALFLWQGSFTDSAALLTFAELLTFFFLCWATASIVIRRLRRGAHAT